MDEPVPPRTGVRAVLTTRGLFIVAGIVTALTLALLAVGARSTGAGSVTTVTGAPLARSSAVASTGSPSYRSSPTPSAAAVLVHVLGAVEHPGLLELRSGDRVQRAIDAAGGVTNGADLARVNLARPLIDGEQLYVPTVGEDVPVVPGPAAVSGGTAGSGGAGVVGGPAGEPQPVDLNTADTTALQTLPGIGPGLAGRIIAWRDANGRFTSVEDLREVSGIGDVRFAELEPLVRV